MLVWLFESNRPLHTPKAKRGIHSESNLGWWESKAVFVTRGLDVLERKHTNPWRIGISATCCLREVLQAHLGKVRIPQGSVCNPSLNGEICHQYPLIWSLLFRHLWTNTAKKRQSARSTCKVALIDTVRSEAQERTMKLVARFNVPKMYTSKKTSQWGCLKMFKDLGN